MQKSEMKASTLPGYRVHATDGMAGALRDLVVDLSTWDIRYLVVDAEAWAVGHEVLIAPRSIGAIDEARRELSVELTVQEVQQSPSLAAGDPVIRDFEENWYRYHGWEDYWRAEVDQESVPEPPIPPAPPAEEPMPAEVNADNPGLVRLELLSGWNAATIDRLPLVITDLVFDDTDWRVDYLEIETESVPVCERCLIDVALVVGADPKVERLYLSVDAEELHRAPRRPHPGVDGDCEVHTLEEGIAK